MSEKNNTVLSGEFSRVNGQLVSTSKLVPVRAMTDEELAGIYINRRKIDTSTLHLLTSLFTGLKSFIRKISA